MTRSTEIGQTERKAKKKKRKKSQFGREEEKPSVRSLEVILEFISGWIPKIFGTGGGA